MSARQIGVAAAFSGMALAIALAHLTVPIPGIPGGGGMDPSEIIRTIGAALGGPSVGLVIGLFGSVSSISNVITHIPATVFIGWMYKKIYDYPKTQRIIYWVLSLALYYYIFLVPLIALTTSIQYFKGLDMFIPMIVTVTPGITPEFIVTTIVTTIIWGALPPKYTKPLW
jgi:riboflavin transporter FmnP